MREVDKMRRLASAPRGHAHVCGLGGCLSIEYLPGEQEWVSEQRIEWADAYKREHGDFPDTDAQIAFIIDAADRYRNEVWSIVERRSAMAVVVPTDRARGA